jgi:hypothetical protein
VVNGAAPARDSALTTASAEMKFSGGLSLAATFEGESSDVTRSYAEGRRDTLGERPSLRRGPPPTAKFVACRGGCA